MNIETLNHWGGRFLDFAGPMFWQSSLLIAVVFLFDYLLARRVRAAVRYALWMMVLVKLVLPPALALPTGATWWLWRAKPSPMVPLITHYTVTDEGNAGDFVPQPVHIVVPPPKLNGEAWAMLAAGAVGAGLLSWVMFRWVRVARKVRRADASENLNDTLADALTLARWRGLVRVKLMEDKISPAVYGLFRPVILLPRALAERLSDKQLRAVLVHEIVHLRRGDVWVNCAQTLLQIFYWWHPLLWLANTRIRRLREEAVDDAVMLALRDEAETYAPTLLEVAKFAFRRPLASLGLVGILESRSALRQRIERLADFRPPRKAGITLLSLCGIFAFGAVALPMGQAPVPATPPLPPASATPSQAFVLIEGRFFWMPPGGFEKVTAGLPYDIGHSDQRIVDVKQFGEIDQRIHTLNFKPFLRPRIETRSGMEADFYVGDPTNGVGLDCTLFVTDKRIDLALKAKFRSDSWHDTTYLIAHEHASVENNGGVILRVPDPGNASRNLVLVIGVKTVEPPPASLEAGTNAMIGASAGRKAIYEELNRIHLDVYYQGTTLDNVLTDLTKRSQEQDPQKKGIRFLFSTAMPLPVFINPSTGMPVTATEIGANLTLANASLTQILDAICKAADHPIQYYVEDDRVVFAASINSGTAEFDSAKYEMRTFKVNTNAFLVNLSMMYKSQGHVSEALRRVFSEAGADLYPPKTIFYNDGMGVLFVQATKQDLDIIERVIQVLDQPPQIHIKARFFEMPSTADIVAKMSPLDKSGGSEAGILTALQMKTLLHQLIFQNAVEELGEPEATTIGGRQTQMRATETQQVLTNFLFQPLPRPRHPAIVAQTSDVEFGPMFDVVPIVLADGYTISLKATGMYSQFFGYADTKGIKGCITNYDGDQIQLPVALPAIKVTSATVQQALLYDGQTLVLFPTEEQALPYLPDEKSRERIAEHIRQAEKKDGNKTLVVFVTVTLIDPAGNRIHSDDDMSFAKNTIPPQPQISDTVVP